MFAISYLNPFSQQFNVSTVNFNKLTTSQKAITILVTVLASIASIPFLSLGGVATFRCMVERYTFEKIYTNVTRNKVGTKEEPDHKPHSSTAIKVNHFASSDDSLIKMNPKFSKHIYGRPAILQSNPFKKEAKLDKLSMPTCTHPSSSNEGFKPPSNVRGAQKTVFKSKFPLQNKPHGTTDDGSIEFDSALQSAKSKVLTLHENFKAKFQLEVETPTINPGDGVACSTLFQFKTAVKIAKSNFPKLISLAINEMQSIEVARLIQIIMCGFEAEEAPLPGKSSCFQLFGINGEKIKSSQLTYGEPFEIFMGEDTVIPYTNTSFREVLQNTIEFLEEYIGGNGGGKSYSFGETVVPIVLNGDQDFQLGSFIKDVNELYTDFLLHHPEKVKEIIDGNKKTPYFSILVDQFKKYPSVNSFFADSNFPGQGLYRSLRELLPNTISSKTAAGVLNDLLDNSVILQKSMNDLVVNSGCDLKDIEPLVRIKVLEILSLMQEGMMSMENTFQFKGEMKLLKIKNTDLLFDFCPKGETKPSNFNSMIIKKSVELTAIKNNFSELKMDLLCDQVKIADMEIDYRLHKTDFSQIAVTWNPYNTLYLNWQISDPLVDFFVTEMDPEVLKQQPHKKCPLLLEKFKKSKVALDKLAAIKPKEEGNQTYVGAMMGVAYSVWGTATWLFSSQKETSKTEDNSPEEQLKDFKKLLNEIVDTTKEFIKYYLMADSTDQSTETILKDHKTSVETLIKEMKLLQSQYKAKNEKTMDDFLNPLISSLESLLPILPVSKGEKTSLAASQKTYLQSLYGLLYESSEPYEIKWKAQKYETQIGELKTHLRAQFSKLNQLSDNLNLEDSWVEVPGNCPNEVKPLIDILDAVSIDLDNENRYSLAYLNELRKAYNEEFIPKLRELIRLNPKNTHIQDVCEVLFTKIDLKKECKETIRLFNELGAQIMGQKKDDIDPSVHGNHPHVKKLNTLFARLNAVVPPSPLLSRWGNSAKGQWNRGFDPTIQGNPIHVLYEVQLGGKKIKALGMGSPTIEDKHCNVSLTPEFLGFARAYKGQETTPKKRHLFVLNQNTMPKADWKSKLLNGDETGRCNEILEAQDRPDLKGALHCIALAKNSPFYYQKGAYEKINHTDQFKEEFYRQVFLLKRSESGCYIPESIREEIPNFVVRAKELMDKVHKHLFADATELDQKQRRIFIEAYYDLLIKFVIIELNVDSFNISCKDAIDRGAQSNDTFFSNSAIASTPFPENKSTDSKEDKNLFILPTDMEELIEILMMSRAFLVRKRPPIEERVEVFIEGYDYNMNHPDKLKNLYQDAFGAVQLIAVC